MASPSRPTSSTTTWAPGLVGVVFAAVFVCTPAFAAKKSDEGEALRSAVEALEEKVRDAKPEAPLGLWVGPDGAVGRALSTLLAARFAEGALAPVVVQAPDAATAELRARQSGLTSLVRLTWSIEGKRLVVRGDALGTWVNFWSGKTPTRPPTPAAVVLVDVPTDPALAVLAGDPSAAPPRVGGALRIVVSNGKPPTAGTFATETASYRHLMQRLLTSPALCRHMADGRMLGVAVREVRLEPDGRLAFVLGPDAVLTPDALTSWLTKLKTQSHGTPSALLHALKTETVRTDKTTDGTVVSFALAYPQPELAANLCHPSFALSLEGKGPFLRSGGGPTARTLTQARGPFGALPLLDGIELSLAPGRAASRLFGLGRADLVAGAVEGPAPAAPDDGVPASVTYLLFRPASVGPGFAEAVDASVGRDDLARLFVEAPAQPMSQLMPRGWLGASAESEASKALPASATSPGASTSKTTAASAPSSASARPPPPAPASSAPASVASTAAAQRTLTLAYDGELEDQRAVAERLQVRLLSLGHRLSVRPLSAEALANARVRGEYDLVLVSTLLPKTATGVLSTVLTLAGRQDLLGLELPPLAALSDESARAARLDERLRTLGPRLSLVPLYAQGLRLFRGPKAANLGRDVYGLPVLEEAHLPATP